MLDFGLMTEVTPTQRIALFEYIAHLTTQVSCQHCAKWGSDGGGLLRASIEAVECNKQGFSTSAQQQAILMFERLRSCQQGGVV